MVERSARRHAPTLSRGFPRGPAGVASAPAIAWAMEVVSRDGLTVRCREALSVQDLAALLRGPAC
jgi:hypothetical protein